MDSIAAKRSPLQPQFCQLLVAERALARRQPGVRLQATVTSVNTSNNEPLSQSKDTVVISVLCLIHNNQKNLSIGAWRLQDRKHQLVTVEPVRVDEGQGHHHTLDVLLIWSGQRYGTFC